MERKPNTYTWIMLVKFFFMERLCKSNGVVIEYVPPDTPKLNNMVERGFAIRWKISKTLMQNAVLKDSVKLSIKFLTEAIKTAGFLNDECIQKVKSESIHKIFWCERTRQSKAKNFY